MEVSITQMLVINALSITTPELPRCTWSHPCKQQFKDLSIIEIQLEMSLTISDYTELTDIWTQPRKHSYVINLSCVLWNICSDDQLKKWWIPSIDVFQVTYTHKAANDGSKQLEVPLSNVQSSMIISTPKIKLLLFYQIMSKQYANQRLIHTHRILILTWNGIVSFTSMSTILWLHCLTSEVYHVSSGSSCVFPSLNHNARVKLPSSPDWNGRYLP